MGLFQKKKQQELVADRWYKVGSIRIKHGIQVEIKNKHDTYVKYKGYTGEVIGCSGLFFLVDIGGLALEVHYEDVELVTSPVQGVQIQIISNVCWND